MSILDFPHKQSAHCESGATASLLSHAGFPLSEAMVFGIGAGIFFGYVPFVKLNGFPLTTYRTRPGAIFSRVTKNLHCKVIQKRYRHKKQAMAELDQMLEQGIAVGLQTSVFWLPYIPAALRFHFNAHNLIVIGKEEDRYLISDPVVPDLVWCPAQDLENARFAQGALAPKGRCYYLDQVPDPGHLAQPMVQGMRSVCSDMLAPIPVAGVRGMRLMARSMPKWEQKYGQRRAKYCLAQVVRMQEEIGTGGAGFRFIYAAFLQEAASYLGAPQLAAVAQDLTAIGDSWREFALQATRCCKGRSAATYTDLATLVADQAEREERLFRQLRALTKQLGR
ncbi:MAG: BtrH N-terminal domain-containing protein [Desulfuromonas sp.]|nr:BtrH N-terminal domain-containing protein [Desulfuromonas sp.]